MCFYMEGKTMKKRIISVLSFLMLLICLSSGCTFCILAIFSTGCNKEVTQAEKGEIEEIVQNIKDNENYQLPEGYIVKNPVNVKNRRIVHIIKEKPKNLYQVRAKFDISKEKVDCLQIKVVCNDVVIWCLLIFLLSFVVFLVIQL